MDPISNEYPLQFNPVVITRFKRDEDGLVIGQTYHYTDEGKVDWKAMLRSQDLYVKREFREEVVKEYGKPLGEIDLTTVKDRYLCVLVGGINRLAHLRGIRSIDYPFIHVSDGKAVASCQIEFIGNFETEGLPMVCTSVASATVRSVDADFVPYLETFAENRAFARCVKRALQINILSDVEVGGEGKKRIKSVDGSDDDLPSSSPTGNDACHVLATKCANPPAPLTPLTFETVKAGAMHYPTELKSAPAEWTSFESIPPADAWTLLGKIEEKAKAETLAAASGTKNKKK